MSVDQVMTRQIHRSMMHGVNKVGLHHGIVSMLHWIGCVDYIHLERIQTTNTHTCGHENALVTFGHYLLSSIVNASLLRDETEGCSVIPRP